MYEFVLYVLPIADAGAAEITSDPTDKATPESPTAEVEPKNSKKERYMYCMNTSYHIFHTIHGIAVQQF